MAKRKPARKRAAGRKRKRAAGKRAAGKRAAGKRAAGKRAAGKRAAGKRAPGERAPRKRATGKRTATKRAAGKRKAAPRRAARPGRLRVIIAKPGLDGHDRGAKVVARALRDGGMEVIYTGLKVTPEQVVQAAIDEDADAIGLSILSGAHMHLVPVTLDLLKKKHAQDIPVFVGGIIPDEDAAKLRKMGVAGVYGPGASTDTIVKEVRRIAQGK